MHDKPKKKIGGAEGLAAEHEAPDGGWGWVVVFSSFLLHIIIDGITYSFGVLFVALLDDFKGGKGDTAWILSIFVGITLGGGPLASALVNRYNCRLVTIVGSVIGAVGFIISPFATSMWYLYITLGFVAGIGFALVYLPAIVIVGYYFEKKRALATGLAVAGSGFGTFIFAPLMALLVEEYGWKQTCFFLAGIMLNCAVCGALFRPLPIEMKKARGGGIAKAEDKKVKHDKVEGKSKEVKELKGSAEAGGKAVAVGVKKDLLSVDAAVRRDAASSAATAASEEAATSHRPLHRKDVFYSASLHNIPLYTSNHDMYVASNVSVARSNTSGSVAAARGGCCSCIPPDMAATFREMVDVSLLRDAAFILFLVSNFFTNFGFNAPFLFVPDRAHDKGIDAEAAAFLLSVIGIANTFGRVFFGWLADLKKLKQYRLHIYNTGLVVAGVATAISALGSQYWDMVVYCVVFGISIGCYVSLTAVILVDLLGLDKLTSSFGMTLLVQGVAVLIGPPICGEIYDVTGSYVWPFVVLGISIGISGAILYFLPCVTRCSQQPAVALRDVEMGKRIGVPLKAIEGADGVNEEMVTLHQRLDSGGDGGGAAGGV